MNQVESAALMLAGATLAFAAIIFALWWLRRPRIAPAAPRLPRTPREGRESRLPKLQRKAKANHDPVQISPARLARISGKAPLDRLSEPEFAPELEPASESAPDTTAVVEPLMEAAAIEARLESSAAEAGQRAHETEEPVQRDIEALSLHIVPQIPLRDAILTSSWLGGRPRLPDGMAWPEIKGEPADFLAQIDCAGLPRDLWDGLGPREGTLAFFIDRRGQDVRVLHLRDAGTPVAPPRAPGDPGGCFGPHGGLARGDLASFAVRAFPEWPVDLVAVRPGDEDARDEGDPGQGLYERGYDIADPAFHPFDWGSMTAMITLLEMRLGRLTIDTTPFAGASAEDMAELERCAATNREARERAGEIIAIVHDSATRESFSPGDATAVMAALHAIRWTQVVRTPVAETGGERIGTITLPLTTHRADADLWVHDYQTILFDRAKHAWCANPDSLSAPARAFYEPCWRDLAAREMASMSREPFGSVRDCHDGRDTVLIELPSSGLMSRVFGDEGHLVVTIDKADLAIGDFSKLRTQVTRHVP